MVTGVQSCALPFCFEKKGKSNLYDAFLVECVIFMEGSV